MRALSSFAVAVMCVVPVGCRELAAPTEAPPAPQFINFGTPTGPSLFANVGAIVLDWFEPLGTLNEDDQWCTGTLIAPTVFLTAAHCLIGLPPNTTMYVTFDDALAPSLDGLIAAAAYYRHPQYSFASAHQNDLGVVILPAGATAGITPASLPPAGYLTQLAAKGSLTRARFVNVGYGASARASGNLFDGSNFQYDGLRNYSLSEFMALQPTWLGLLMNSNATGLGGDCYGDSGGPKFLASNTSMVVATVSKGDVPCRATSWDWRLDTSSARGFLGSYMTLP